MTLNTDQIALERHNDYLIGRFNAMASPCEILMATDDERLGWELCRRAATETWRIERKYSRYTEDSVTHQLNQSQGKPILVDDETAMLLNFAEHVYELSEGAFDITSGVLRRLWRFSGDHTVTLPTEEEVEALKCLIGFSKLTWESPLLTVPPSMEIDFGGIGKEYAVDKSLSILMATSSIPILVNYGGDMATNYCVNDQSPWRVGIEDPEKKGEAVETVELRSGGLATSGSTYRYVVINGKKYGHVLDPKRGRPVENAPLSVTVAGENCVQAGMFATLAMLQGENAEEFLEGVGVTFYRCKR